MQVYEGTLKLYLLKDIFNNNYQEKISAIIDKSLLIDEKQKDFHEKRALKGYVFNGFFDKNAKNKDFKYPAGNVYSVKIRSLNKELMDYFKNNLCNIRTLETQALTFEYRELPNTIVKTIYSLTPTICKFEDGYWQKSHTLDDVIERIEQNARKKLSLIGENVPENAEFIINIKKLNNYPIVKEYNRKNSKNGENRKIKLLCDKFEFEISPNENSQKLAKAIIGAGLLEMNARGFGYVNVKTI